jgi:signal transduction histidine kinase
MQLPRLFKRAGYALSSARAGWRMSQHPPPSARVRRAGRRASDIALEGILEEERAYIARELHDDLGQLLTTMRIDLSLLQKAPADSPNAKQLMASLDALLLTATTSLRHIANKLRPRALDNGGLYYALQSLLHDFERRHGVRCSLQALPQDLELDDRTSTAIFRIVQESLTNIARHAEAGQVTLRVQRQDAHLQLSIQDDGRGIDQRELQKPASFGLLGMRERVAALHGEIRVDGNAHGTRIELRLPLSGAARASE